MKWMTTTLGVSLVTGVFSMAYSAPPEGTLGGAELQGKETGHYEKKRVGQGRFGRAQDLFIELDTDDSKGLSLDEFSKAPRLAGLGGEKKSALFSKLDGNSDGVLEMFELKPQPAESPMVLLDKDQSGGVSLEEFMAWKRIERLTPEQKKTLFGKMDADVDGVVTEEEVFAKRRGERGKTAFLIADTDGSGQLTMKEFSSLPLLTQMPEEHLQKVFDRIDQDKDSLLGLGEFEVMRGRHMRGRTMYLWKQLRATGVLQEGEAVTKERLVAGGVSQDLVESVFEQFDRDGNDVIEGEEVPSVTQRSARKAGHKRKSKENRERGSNIREETEKK